MQPPVGLRSELASPDRSFAAAVGDLLALFSYPFSDEEVCVLQRRITRGERESDSDSESESEREKRPKIEVSTIYQTK